MTTSEEYELFVHTIRAQFPSVQSSTLAFIRRGVSLARVQGELTFTNNMRLVIRERLVFDRLPIVIDSYGYEVWKGQDKLYWYDSQPHPNDPSLQSTHPHHKHVPPDIKHNRVPAPDIHFRPPNLPVLIREIEMIIDPMS